MNGFLQNVKVRLGFFALCQECDADNLFWLKRSAKKFYGVHGAMHRHPSKHLKLVS